MIELDCASMSSKQPLKVRFSSELFGQVQLSKKQDWVLIDRGIALKVLDEVRTRSVVSTGTWYNFKAHALGVWASVVGLSTPLLNQLVSVNPDLVIGSLAEIKVENSHKFDFKRRKRPFVELKDGYSILWEYYPEIRRIGLYRGDGLIRFYDEPELEVILQR